MIELTQLYLALSDLEPLVTKSRSPYLNNLKRAKATIYAALPDDLKRKLYLNAQPHSAETFERLVEESEKNPGWQDHYLIAAVRAGAGEVSPERIERALAKLTHHELRQPLLDYAWFMTAESLIADGALGEAVSAAHRVEQLEYRAFALFDAAVAFGRDRQRATELLDLAEWCAAKAKNSNEKAKALVSIASLYSKFDPQRSGEILREAVETINRVSEPDPDSVTFARRLTVGGSDSVLTYPFIGFTPEETFRTSGALDFDGALVTAESLEDRTLRARAVLALSSLCLKEPDAKPKSDKNTVAGASHQH
ncbi:MAG TPA: hypothetical protein VFD58_16320 [Blastocatellia bacterium]|nr:hypothetical protein [Blastocatellia bacterium]